MDNTPWGQVYMRGFEIQGPEIALKKLWCLALHSKFGIARLDAL